MLCQPARRFGWIASARARQSSISPSPMRTAVQKLQARPQTMKICSSRVREALLDSVRHHLVADVPVGAFLSSGIDSGALVGLMRDAGQQDIQTVTLAFEEFRGRSEDEAPIAAEIAAQYGTRHTTRVVTEQEFRDDLPKILEAMDQPTIDGLNTWFVSKAARELGLKVAISGLGGDELFGGYPSFRDVPLCVRALAIPGRIPWLGRSGAAAADRSWSCLSMRLNPKAAGLLKYGGDLCGRLSAASRAVHAVGA